MCKSQTFGEGIKCECLLRARVRRMWFGPVEAVIGIKVFAGTGCSLRITRRDGLFQSIPAAEKWISGVRIDGRMAIGRKIGQVEPKCGGKAE
jgi:hypothetical protein